MKLRYNQVIGIGGIGTGMLFESDENRTLGRNESRLAHLSDAKDYCKLHIVMHYIAALLNQTARAYPIGYVGEDGFGEMLIDQMRAAGMDVSHVSRDTKLPTMTSVCLQYPDKDGCNVTSSNSACDQVTPEYVIDCMQKIGVDDSTMVIAIPEVRLESRIEMLRMGKEKGAFCALSVPESEAAAFRASGALAICDFLAVNEREALVLAPGDADPSGIALRLHEQLCDANPGIMLLVTCGGAGAYSVYRSRIEYIPRLPVSPLNTTGAGDAMFGGVIAALAMGLPFQKGAEDRDFGQTPLKSAVELGTLCAGMAVEVKDSIALHVNPDTILERIAENRWEMDGAFRDALSRAPAQWQQAY